MKLIAALLVLCLPAFPLAKFQGYVQKGAVKPVVQGIPSTTNVQGSFPGATVSVFVTGTVTLATIYSDDLSTPTPKSNPFMADASGFFAFFADDGTGIQGCGSSICGSYDVTFSGTGISIPFTWGSWSSFDPQQSVRVVSDSQFSTLQQACNYASSRSATLIISKSWASLSNQTCTANSEFITGGLIQPSSGQTVILSGVVSCGEYQQCFDISLGGIVTISHSPQELNPVWWGADTSGATDSLAAFRAAYSSSDYVYILNGTYTVSAPFTIGRPSTFVQCQSSAAIIQYVGSSPVDSVVTLGVAGFGSVNIRFEGCTVKGNSHVTSAVHAFEFNHSVARSLRLKDAVSALYVDTCVSSSFEHIEVSEESGAYVFRPTYGINVYNSNTITIDKPTIEAIGTQVSPGTGAGIWLHGATVATKIIGGTSESNSVGVQMDNLAWGTVIIGMDNEANYLADVIDGGQNNSVIGGFFSGGYSPNTSIHYISTSRAGLTQGIQGSIVLIDAAAEGITVLNNQLGDQTGVAIIDNGAHSMLLNNRFCCGGGIGPIPNKIPGYSDIGDLSSGVSLKSGTNNLSASQAFNLHAFETGSSANNAWVLTFLDADGNQPALGYGTFFTYCGATHSLQAGSNTIVYNGSSAIPLKSHFGNGANISTPYVAGVGSCIDVIYNQSQNWFQDRSQ